MTDLVKKFSDAAKTISSSNNPMRECVYSAYVDHISDIDIDDLPEELQIIYEAVTNRLTSVEPTGDIGNDEASYLAKDILYMSDVLRSVFKT